MWCGSLREYESTSVLCAISPQNLRLGGRPLSYLPTISHFSLQPWGKTLAGPLWWVSRRGLSSDRATNQAGWLAGWLATMVGYPPFSCPFPVPPPCSSPYEDVLKLARGHSPLTIRRPRVAGSYPISTSAGSRVPLPSLEPPSRERLPEKCLVACLSGPP